MYFKPEMITAIVEGRKTQTRRIVKLGEEISGYRYDLHGERILSVSNGRIKWELDRTYAVCPGRGKPGVWWNELLDGVREWQPERPGIHNHWRPFRIRITAIRRERLQDISEEDARAEGVEPQLMTGSGATAQYSYSSSYAVLWDRINTKPGTRWADAPDVWVLSFEVVR